MKIKTKKEKGMTMVEVLVGVLLLAILSSAIYGGYALGIKMSTHNRLRVQASQIAEEKIESIRALKYNDVGVQGGIPQGNIPSAETVVKDGVNYSVHTSIRYIDDSYDGAAPTDTAPADYKQVEVKVNWPTNIERNNLQLTTFISPPRIETNLGTGVFVINAIDGQGSPISDATVHIVNNSVNPHINMSTETANNGSLILPGVPVANSTYELTVSKSGYETAQTYPPYPQSTFNPLDIHASITANQVTSKSFVVDKTSSLNLQFNDIHAMATPNLTFAMYGGRVIGSTAEQNYKQVYLFNEASLTCDTDGKWASSGLSKGPYYFTINDPIFDVITTNPILPWTLAPDTNQSVEIIMGRKTEEILVFDIKEQGTNTIVDGATVQLSDEANTFSQQATSDLGGIAYFPQMEDPAKTLLTGTNYNYTISKTGYQTYTGATTVSGLTRLNILLTKTP